MITSINRIYFAHLSRRDQRLSSAHIRGSFRIRKEGIYNQETPSLIRTQENDPSDAPHFFVLK
jgi:hypothetical protein